MKSKCLLSCILFGVFLFFPGVRSYAGPEETVTAVANAIQSGNAAEVSKHFNTMVDLTLPGNDDSYSKAQAGQILKDFFSQNPVKAFKITKQGVSPDGSYYVIGSLETAKKTFRIYFIIKTSSGQNLIHQFQAQEG